MARQHTSSHHRLRPVGIPQGTHRLLCSVFIGALILALAGCGRNAEEATDAPDRPMAPGSGGGPTATPAVAVAPKGRVVLYTSADQEYAEQIVRAFASTYPEITILPRYDTELTKTTGLVERLRAEAAAPQADIFWSSENFLTIQLASENLLVAPSADVIASLGEWPATFRDPENRWFGFAGRARVVAYHPDRVSDNEVPQTWQELAEPRYRGRVVIADPNFGTTRGHVATSLSSGVRRRAKPIFRLFATTKFASCAATPRPSANSSTAPPTSP